MKSLLHVFFVLMTFIFVGGCCKEQDKSLQNKSQEKVTTKKRIPSYLKDMVDDDVLMSCWEKRITKRDFSFGIGARVKIVTMSMPQGMTTGPDREQIELKTLSVLPIAISREWALMKYAETNGISVAESDLSTCRFNMQCSCRQDMISYASFLQNFNEKERAYLENRVTNEATVAAVRRDYLGKLSLKPTKEEVDKVIKRIVDYNRSALATNRLVWARATNIWHEVRSGEGFGDYANQYSEDENEPENGEWGEFKLGELKDDGRLAEVVANLKPGEVSEPIEADNGICILKLNAINAPEGETNMLAITSADTTYDLSRIFLRLPVVYESASREVVEKSILETKEHNAFDKFTLSLIKGMPLKFPCGRVIFQVAERASKLPNVVQ